MCSVPQILQVLVARIGRHAASVRREVMWRRSARRDTGFNDHEQHRGKMGLGGGLGACGATIDG